MTNRRVLITTSYLEHGDQVHRMLGDAGFEVAHSSQADRAASGQTLHEAIAEVDAVIAGTESFSADVIEAAQHLKVIVRTGVGYDNVDLDAAARRDVLVCNTPGANRQSVAELTLALMLNCARLIPAGIDSVRSGSWQQRSGRELNGATLGVIGFGSIGKAVAQTATALGMRVIAHDPLCGEATLTQAGVESRPLEDLLAESDFVTLHISLSKDTYHLINEAALARMKPTAFLINTARGGVVDEPALVTALESGGLAGAALDVLEHEPMPADSELASTRNLIVTPHIAGATAQARSRSSLSAAEQVIDFFADRTVAHPVRQVSTATA